jgi:hypothetical protein
MRERDALSRRRLLRSLPRLQRLAGASSRRWTVAIGGAGRDQDASLEYRIGCWRRLRPTGRQVSRTLTASAVAADSRRVFGCFSGVGGDLWKHGDRERCDRASAGCGEKDSS